MRILTESEINQLCAEMLEKAEQQLIEAENRKAERLASFQNIQEKQYQGSLQSYQRQLAYYEQALKTYEDNIAREEIEYPKRVKAWEENEELRKRLLEQSYTQSVAAYEQSKQQHEAAGLPFHMAYPKKMEFRPTPKPHKMVFHKPIEPIPPRKPEENRSHAASIFSAMFSPKVLMFSGSFSDRARQQLRKIDCSTPEGKEKAIQIIFRELYLNKRINMECSPAEGRGVSPALDGLYGEKLTVFELELCRFVGFKGTILHNLEIEAGNRTIQIDVLFITQKGIFVIESKNYSGSISGAEYQNKWTLRTKRKDYHFYNPISQNQAHIQTLSQIVHVPRFFSLVAFSERCDLEYIDIHKQDVFVFNRYALRDVVHDIFENTADILSESDVNSVTSILRQYCADDSASNPNYKEIRSYYSAYSKLDAHPNASYQHKKHHRPFKPYSPAYDDDFEDYDDYDDDEDFDDYDD